MSARTAFTAAGILLVVAAAYALANAGRIDIIDGQYRFEVAKNILDDHSIQVVDPFLEEEAVKGIGGMYSHYGISGSLVALPLVWLGRQTAAISVDREQFFFSFTSAILGALTAALLFVFYLRLGIRRRAAIGWTLVAAFATLAFPASTTVFDQAQHAFFVLGGCYGAFMAGERDSMLHAVLGGACLAVLVNYQETYALLFPTLGIAALGRWPLEPGARRRAFERAAVFMFGGVVGLLVWGGFNQFRFGSLLFSGKGVNHPPTFGNPFVGLAGLLVSPGKSLFLYSPPAILSLSGLYYLLRTRRLLALAIISASAAQTLLISTLTFYGGDWCWGPRYFVPILPLLALALPFVPHRSKLARASVAALVAAGVVVQLLAISIDQHRFFYGRSLGRYFWYADPTYYFHDSALFARPHELLDTIRDGVPAEAERFRPGPYAGLVTYAVFGNWGYPQLAPPAWMRRYQVFWLPRPWPLWMRALPASERPVRLGAAEVGVGLAAAVGLLLLAAGRDPRAHRSPP